MKCSIWQRAPDALADIWRAGSYFTGCSILQTALCGCSCIGCFVSQAAVHGACGSRGAVRARQVSRDHSPHMGRHATALAAHGPGGLGTGRVGGTRGVGIQ